MWGDPDDIEPLPDWMKPDTYRNKQPVLHGFKSKPKTLEEVAAEALKKPPIPILLQDPTKKG